MNSQNSDFNALEIQTSKLNNYRKQLKNYEKFKELITVEYSLEKNNSAQYKNINNRHIDFIIRHIIDETSFMLTDFSELEFYDDEYSLVKDLPYNTLLLRLKFAINKVIEGVSLNILELKNIIGEKNKFYEFEYNITCNEFIMILKEGELCLEKSDTKIYRTIAENQGKEWTNVKQQIYKHKEEFPELIELLNQRKIQKQKMKQK